MTRDGRLRPKDFLLVVNFSAYLAAVTRYLSSTFTVVDKNWVIATGRFGVVEMRMQESVSPGTGRVAALFYLVNPERGVISNLRWSGIAVKEYTPPEKVADTIMRWARR